MDKQEKIKKIREILAAEYFYKIPVYFQAKLADELYVSMFEEKNELEDLLAIIFEYEQRVGMEDSQWDAVFPSLLDLLECDRQSAVRLYNNFMECLELFDTFMKLVNEFDAYLTKEELDAVIERGCDLYGREFLIELGVIDDDEEDDEENDDGDGE